MQADAIDDVAWVFPVSWRPGHAPAADEVTMALEQWETAFEEYETAFATWCRRADDFGISLDLDAIQAEIGPQPTPPPVPTADAGPTLLSTGGDGTSYTVMGPGFDSDVEHRTYTNRHHLLRDLDEIETWRYHDHGARLRSRTERIDHVSDDEVSVQQPAHRSSELT